MRVACPGGGPAGFCLAISPERRQPEPDIAAPARDRPGDTLGRDVVLSDRTRDSRRRNDPEKAGALRAESGL